MTIKTVKFIYHNLQSFLKKVEIALVVMPSSQVIVNRMFVNFEDLMWIEIVVDKNLWIDRCLRDKLNTMKGY